MTGKRIGKVLLAWLCIITLLMPLTANVFAETTSEALTSNSTTALLESIPYREGGKESTGLESEDYDTNRYAYSVKNFIV